MENKNLDSFLKSKMSLNELGISEPKADLVSAARKKIDLRRKKMEEPMDLLAVISGFFNLQIKLYQAGLATLIIGGYIYYFTKTENIPTKTIVTQYVTDDSSVNSSTVLASILTFIVRN